MNDWRPLHRLRDVHNTATFYRKEISAYSFSSIVNRGRWKYDRNTGMSNTTWAFFTVVRTEGWSAGAAAALLRTGSAGYMYWYNIAFGLANEEAAYTQARTYLNLFKSNHFIFSARSRERIVEELGLFDPKRKLKF